MNNNNFQNNHEYGKNNNQGFRPEVNNAKTPCTSTGNKAGFKPLNLIKDHPGYAIAATASVLLLGGVAYKVVKCGPNPLKWWKKNTKKDSAQAAETVEETK